MLIKRPMVDTPWGDGKRINILASARRRISSFLPFLLHLLCSPSIIFFTMGLTVRVRLCGDSLAITLPAQIAKMHDISLGDYMEISLIGTGEFKIKKV